MTANAQTNLSFEKDLSAVAQFRQGLQRSLLKKREQDARMQRSC